MNLRQIFIAGVFIAMAVPAFATTRYASYLGGTGPVGCTTNANNGTACHLRAALLTMTAGDVLILKDGTFTGTNGMLVPTSGLSGTAANRITVMAENDGAVTIDGQVTFPAVKLAFNDYWTIQGINTKNSLEDGVAITDGSDHNEIKRVVVWDANTNANRYCVHIYGTGADYNLIEDVAAFGTCRKTFGDTQGPSHNTFRRVWGQWEHTDCVIGCPGNGPNTGFELNYADSYLTIENGIFTWKENGTPFDPYGVFSRTGGSTGTNRDIFSKYLGNIVYLKSGQPFSTDIVVRSGFENQLLFKDLAIFIPPSLSSRFPINFYGCTEPVVAPTFAKVHCNMTDTPVIDMRVTNLSLIGGDISNLSTDIDGTDWIKTNIATGATNAALYGAQSLFVNDGTKGATICYRYENGTLTADPLWPWPMDDRIEAALISSGRTGIVVTDEIEAMFGTIPDQCRTGTPSGGSNIVRWTWSVTATPGATHAAAAIAQTGSAVAIANNGAGSFSSGSASQTFSFNVPAGSNRMLGVCAAADVPITGITFGGVALTALTSNSISDNYVGLWYLKNPSVSTANIVTTASGAWKGVVNAYALTNVHQTTTFTDYDSTAASGSSSIQVALDAATSSDFLLDCANVRNETAAPSTLTPNVGIEGTDFGYSPSGRGSSRTLTPLTSGTIIVTCPISGSTQQRPQTTTVCWTTSDISSGTVDLTFSFDGFVTSYPIASGVAYNAGTYMFTPTWPAQESMQVRVCQGAFCGTSESFITRGQYLK